MEKSKVLSQIENYINLEVERRFQNKIKEREHERKRQV
jgi:hypothetical protein